MRPYVQRLKRLYEANPTRCAWAAVIVVTCLGLGIAGTVWLNSNWERYRLQGTLLTVDLPAEPTASRAGIDGKAGALYDLTLADIAVIASGGPVPAGEDLDPSAVVNQSLRFVRNAPDVSELKFQAGREVINGEPCILVAGTFLRDGVPARLTGAFFFTAEAHAHIICFWSDPKGAKKAARIMQSVRLDT